MPIEDCDFFVRLAPLPVGVHALISDNGDTTFSMYLNQDEDFEHQLDSYCHELMHVLRDDFHNGKSIAEVEGL